jgi:peptidoglycan/xylan/chitin deacetylase (PgdA/CDA1 family)
MGRPRIIEWPNKAKICVTFIIPWEVWPDNFASHESLQRHGGATLPPPKAVFKQNMALITEREYGDRVGIWRIMDMFNRNNLKITFLMNGLKVEQFPEECKEFKAQGHEFSSESYEHEYSFMYTREQERESIQKTVAAFEKVLGQKPTGYLSPGH